MSCPRCEELEYELACLRDDRAEAERAAALNDLRAEYGLPYGPARVVDALYRAGGLPMSRAQLCEAVPPVHGGEDTRDLRIVQVWMHRIRQALGDGSVETLWGQGYRLTPQGMAKVKAALES